MKNVLNLLVLTTLILLPRVSPSQPKKSIEIQVHWYEVEPFIYQDKDGNLKGLEYEIVELFFDHLKKTNDEYFTIKWTHLSSFTEVFQQVSKTKAPFTIGVSSFSATRERKLSVNFSPSYLPDVTVLVCSKNIPYTKNRHEFDSLISSHNLSAVTTPFTTFEAELKNLRASFTNEFTTQYVSNDDRILQKISSADNLFGYTDFPIYMIALNNGLDVKRQHSFNIKREGYGFIFPKYSPLEKEVDVFFNSPENRKKINAIVQKYISKDVLDVLNHISLEGNRVDDIYFLIKEEEILTEELANSSLALQTQLTVRNALALLVLLALLSISLLSFVYYKKQKFNVTLVRKNKAIELQKERINFQLNELRTLNSKLTSLNESKDHLIKVVAHDLKSPLNQIIGLIEIFKSCYASRELDKEQQNIIGMINASVRNQKALITKILDIESLDSDIPNVNLHHYNLYDLVQCAIKNFEFQAAQKGIRIISYYQNKETSVFGDLVLMSNILQNLISNALKFSSKNSTVEINLTNSTHHALIEVKDFGQGISQNEIPQLFKKYKKISSTPTDNEDTHGLGLFIVHKYTEAMNGKVWCESIKNITTSFFVELPSHPPETNPPLAIKTREFEFANS